VFIPLVTFACCAWFVYFADYWRDARKTTIAGTFVSANEIKFGRSSACLDISIAGNSSRFRVAIPEYKQSFNQNDFWRNVAPGSTIDICVEQAEFNNPTLPPGDPLPTVYVYGLKEKETTYMTFPDPNEGYISLEERKHTCRIGLIIAVILSTILLLITFPGVLSRIKYQRINRHKPKNEELDEGGDLHESSVSSK
jgi:hypothetical protein